MIRKVGLEDLIYIMDILEETIVENAIKTYG